MIVASLSARFAMLTQSGEKKKLQCCQPVLYTLCIYHTEQLQNHLHADGSVIVLYGSVNTERIQNRLAALKLYNLCTDSVTDLPTSHSQLIVTDLAKKTV